jgi:hypothetical protein
MLSAQQDIQTVRRIFDWPMVMQTVLFIVTIFGIAIYSENRITRMEQGMIYHDRRMERIERIEEELSKTVAAIQATQDKIVAVIRDRNERGRRD